MKKLLLFLLIPISVALCADRLMTADSVTRAVTWPTFPKWRASSSSSQTGIVTATATKLIYGTVDYDTNSIFASSRATPNVAGYYHVSAGTSLTGVSTVQFFIQLYKNGSKIATLNNSSAGPGVEQVSGSIDVVMNGTTDYLEVFIFQIGGVNEATAGEAQYDFFSGFLQP